MTPESRQKEVAANYVSSKLFAKSRFENLLKEVAVLGDLQKVHTPFPLCREMLNKMLELKIQLGCRLHILVMFNLEFVDLLINEYGVSAKRITFAADSDLKEKVAKKLYNVSVVKVTYDKTQKKNERITLMPNLKKQFDVVIMNPPYQNNTCKTNPLWKLFIYKALGLLSNSGYLVAVHPPGWRKPSKIFDFLKEKDFLHLEIRNNGQQNFGSGTRYDWYIVRNTETSGQKATVVDEEGVHYKLDLSQYRFLPHKNIEFCHNLIASNDKCRVIASRSEYGNDKLHMSKESGKVYKYPCVHATPVARPTLMFSSRKNKHFGIKKVIMGKNSPENGFFDAEGEFGITNNAFGLEVANDNEGENIIKALRTQKFANFMKDCKWAAAAIDHKIFQEFRRDFWREFI